MLINTKLASLFNETYTVSVCSLYYHKVSVQLQQSGLSIQHNFTICTFPTYIMFVPLSLSSSFSLSHTLTHTHTHTLCWPSISTYNETEKIKGNIYMQISNHIFIYYWHVFLNKANINSSSFFRWCLVNFTEILCLFIYFYFFFHFVIEILFHLLFANMHLYIYGSNWFCFLIYL